MKRQALATTTAKWMETTIEYIDCPDFRKIPALRLLGQIQSPEDAGVRNRPAPAETPPYLAALYEFPLLSKDQEFHIFRKMHFLRYQAAQLQKKLSLSSLNSRLVKQIEMLIQQANDVRNEIVQANLRLVVSIAKTLVDPANSLDDLISEGNVPLIRAVELFDYTRGLRFSTYATWAVRNGLHRTSSRNRRQQQRFRPDGSDRLEQAPETAPASVQLERDADGERLHQLVSQLDERSQVILRDRFGLEGHGSPARYHELAAKLEISAERVRQLLKRALDQLRSLSEECGMAG